MVLFSELFHTEKAHVRVLKVLQQIFYQPMRDETWISADLVNLLFPNIDELVQLHCELEIILSFHISCPDLQNYSDAMIPININIFVLVGSKPVVYITPVSPV